MLLYPENYSRCINFGITYAVTDFSETEEQTCHKSKTTKHSKFFSTATFIY